MEIMNFNPIHLAYTVMIIGMMFCFVLSKQKKKDIRRECDEFAFSFVKLSNFISPNAEKVSLAIETLEGGNIKVLDIDRQPPKIKDIISRANKDKSVELFADMVEAYDKIVKSVGINRTRKQQFSEPIKRILYMTHTFLNGCEDLTNIDTLEKKNDFDCFIEDQVTHRFVLLKRISGEKADEYLNLNRKYINEIKEIEQEERKKSSTKK